MSTAKEKAELFTKLYQDLNWENYSTLVDNLNKINPHKLDIELAEMSSLYAYFNGLLAKSKRELDRIELDKEIIAANVRNNAVSSSLKKLSQKRLEDIIFCDESYVNKYNEFINAQEKYNLLRGLLDSLRIRNENLIQISANNRAETNLIS